MPMSAVTAMSNLPVLTPRTTYPAQDRFANMALATFLSSAVNSMAIVALRLHIILLTAMTTVSSRIEITHTFAHHDDNRVSTYAKTTFDVSLIRGFHYRRLTKDDYIHYCRSIGMSIDDSSRNSVWQFDIIVSTKQYYFGSLNFGIETFAEKDVPGSKDAVDMTMSNLNVKHQDPFIRLHIFFVGHSRGPELIANDINAARRVAEEGPYNGLMCHAGSGRRLPSLTHMLDLAAYDFRT